MSVPYGLFSDAKKPQTLDFLLENQWFVVSKFGGEGEIRTHITTDAHRFPFSIRAVTAFGRLQPFVTGSNRPEAEIRFGASRLNHITHRNSRLRIKLGEVDANLRSVQRFFCSFQQDSEMTIDQHEYKCPLGAVDRRLNDVHRHWHEAERGYFDPETFRISIQTAIQTLRTVSFILQSNKRIFTNFDPWYEAWQSKLRADPLMRWMVDARNKIEKQGDLETHSFVRAEIIASYYEEGPIIEVPAELFQNSAELIDSIQTEELKKHVLKDGILRIQRRWVENSLPDYELLEAVGIAYGKIAELVADAHLELGLESPSTMVDNVDHTSGRESRGGRLPCMIGHSDARSQDIWLATGQAIKLEQQKVEIDLAETEQAAKRYELDPKEIFPSSAVGPESILNNLFATARKMFTVDGSHITIAFLLNGAAIASMATLNVEEHGEKYLVMRKLANEVIKHGADAVIIIGEVWSARFDASKPYRRAVDSPEKDEFLTGTLVSKYGEPVNLRAKIIRDNTAVTLAETETSRDQAQIAFSPIYTAWGREIPTAWINALRTQDQ